MTAKWAHLVAIGGTGMGALAALLQDKGVFVSGSDGPLYPPMSTFLESRKIPMQVGYKAENLKGSTWGLTKDCPDLIIVGNAISRNNLEAVAVEELLAANKSTRMSFAQALAEYCIGDKKSFVIVGTHGKTTTTSLMAWAFESLKREPGYFIGGIPKNFGQGCKAGSGEVFVSEGDEYDTAYWDKESKFLHYRPTWVLCTGVEFDHADIFASLDAIEKSFLKLIGKTKTGWILIDGESAPLRDSVEKIATQLKEKNMTCHRYGWAKDSKYRILSCEAESLPWDLKQMGSKIKMECPELGRVEFYSPMIGRHNALNVVGVVGTMLSSNELKDLGQIQEFLKSFGGIKRRQEEVYQSPTRVVIDDFAHHPTAIRETIAGIRARYPKFQVAAFFEPRSATSARNILEKEMSACFDEADGIFLTPPTKTNVPEEQKLKIEELIKDISLRPANLNKNIFVEKDSTALCDAFFKWKLSANKNVVALVMSNGPFDGIHKKIADRDKSI